MIASPVAAPVVEFAHHVVHLFIVFFDLPRIDLPVDSLDFFRRIVSASQSGQQNLVGGTHNLMAVPVVSQ
jgi:hypothetical protein